MCGRLPVLSGGKPDNTRWGERVMAYANQASAAVFEYIVNNIRSGKWTPGMKIETEEQLGQSLNVSRIAVRQALEKLDALGVLKRQQGSGTYVNCFQDASLEGMIYYPATQERFLTVLEFRRMFDSCNVELFIQHATIGERAELERNYLEMINRRNDKDQFDLYDNAFHQMIAFGTHNALIIQISKVLTELLVRYQALQYETAGPDHAIKWHGIILDAIQHNNTQLAHICAQTHIENSIHKVKAQIGKE